MTDNTDALPPLPETLALLLNHLRQWRRAGIDDEAIAAGDEALRSALAAQQGAQVPLPFNSAQRRRLWDNSPEIHADAKSFVAFERIVQLVEAAHGIGKQEGQ